MDHGIEDTTQILQLGPRSLEVLIVDDDRLVCERLGEVLASAGFASHAVNSGAAALASLHKCFRPVVIADRNMPDMDGLTLCRTIRSEAYEGYVYLMLLTSRDSEEDILAGLDAGADDYLSKRVSPAQLLARLRTAQRILGLEFSLRTAIEEKNRLAATDALTGANNRRYFGRHLKRELSRVHRYGGDLSLLILDIDHFKSVNDRFGHGVGDEVLKCFARCIADCLPRQNDWFARLGGEEFAVVLPETPIAGAQIVAEKIRSHIGNTPLETSAGPLGVTVSIGVSGLEALVDGVDGEREVFDRLLDSADRCLYRSKEGGRNKVTAADLPTHHRALSPP